MTRYTIARGNLAIIKIGARCFVRDIDDMICFAASSHGARNWNARKATRPEPDLTRKG